MRIKRKTVSGLIIGTILVLFTAVMIYPYLMMFFGSFKTGTELSRNPAWFPRQFTFANYVTLFTYNGGLMVRTFFNGVYIASVYIVITTYVTAMAAFAFAKYRFKGRDLFFTILLCTMMVPRDILIPPLFIMFSKVGMLNTYSVQILPFVANVFGLFLLRQFMLNLPDSVVESARIDGAGHWIIFSRIVMPMSAPAIGALAILLFTQRWNDFLWPVLTVNDVWKVPITVILPMLTDETGNMQMVPWELILTGCTVVTVPIMIVFFSMQDRVMSSMTSGAVKE
jgi:ABC-type glycerol-3-phosphate transport system permease component